jgi:hypothetical protein
MSVRTVCWLLIVALATWCPRSIGADKQGRFMMGGGVGGVTCPQFLNQMASARQAGGVGSVAGSEFTSNFSNYILGFQTGYNMMSRNRFDIFAKLDMQNFDSLYIIESWCKDHPTDKFSDGVIALAEKLAAP